MPSANIAKRISKYVRTRVYHLAGRDPITREPLTRRADMEEIGTRYGGWSIPANLISANSIVYCVGCGEDISFDLGLIERFSCDVFAFDPTPRAIKYVNTHAAANPRYHFSPLGLWDKAERLRFYVPSNPKDVSHSLLNLQRTSDYIEVPVERLSALMRLRQHTRLDLLKLDIEGAEYKVIDSIIDDQLEVGILCVEFDEFWNPLDGDSLQRIRTYVKTILDRGYRMLDAPGNGNYTFLKQGTE
jgi:FkbM family methyltransferase